VGLLAGAQSKAMYLFFMTQDCPGEVRGERGWTAGADASVVVANVGANAAIDTSTAQVTDRRLRSIRLRADGQPSVTARKFTKIAALR
jgi:lipid-binding SYLF domain-containing protein